MAQVLVSGTTSNISSPTTDTFIVESGGILNVLNGGVAEGLITVSAGGSAVVGNGGSTLDTVVSSGGSAVVLSGGSVTDTTVSGGGVEIVSGTETSGTIGPSGLATVFSGGVTFDDVISSTDGTGGFTANSALEILSGGTASGAIVSGTGKLLVRGGGSAVSATAEDTRFGTGSNGGVIVSNGGIAYGTQIDSKGLEVVFAGGTESGAVVHSTGELVDSGGTVSGAVLAGGTMSVTNAGTTFDTQINQGGVEIVFGGSVESGAVVNAGGQLLVSGGRIDAATINANGSATLFAAGVASDVTINGGKLDIQANGGASDTITFTGAGGTLELDAPAQNPEVIATIDGFAVNGDTIDLTGLTYVAGGSVQVLPPLDGGPQTLQITEGSNKASLNFNSSQDFSQNTFLLNPDANGGTVLTLGNKQAATGTFAYYVNGSMTAGSLPSLLRSEQMPDGSWSAPSAITIDGVVASQAVDPSVLVLPNGQFLLTYDNYITDVNADTNHLYTAISTDGVNFSDPQVAVQSASGVFVDPSVIQLGDGSFLMAATYFPGGGALASVNLYTSTDGRSYSPTGVSLPGLNATQLELLPNGNLVIFSNSADGENGIVNEISTDGGETWAPNGVSLAGDYTNPTVLQTAPGQWEMIVDSPIDSSQTNPPPSDQQFSVATSTDGINFTISDANFLQQASVPSLAADPPFIVVAAGSTSVSSPTLNSYLVGSGGTLAVESGGSVSATTVEYNGTLDIASGGSVNGAIDFSTTSGTLQIDGPNAPGQLLSNVISGFTPGDAINLTGITFDPAGHADMDDTTNILTVTEGGTQYTLDFSTADNFAGERFVPVFDKGATELILETIPCYCQGTLIRTPRGECPVEDLEIGDEVITRSGAARPIKWVGRRSYSGRFILGRKDILPICIKAGALDDGLPRRDLWVSPHHAMYFENEAGAGILIEARDLVNGVSIVQARRADEIEYLHIELDSHDVIIAEGAPSETFLDDDNRAMFHNADEYHAIYPDVRGGSAPYCAPRLEEGYEIEVVRRRIEARAGKLPSVRSQAGLLRGSIDWIGPDRIEGWAQSVDHPDAAVCLDIRVGSRLIGQVLANRYRDDLAHAGIGAGYHAFEFALPGMALDEEAVVVCRSLDGVALPCSFEWLSSARSTG